MRTVVLAKDTATGRSFDKVIEPDDDALGDIGGVSALPMGRSVDVYEMDVTTGTTAVPAPAARAWWLTVRQPPQPLPPLGHRGTGSRIRNGGSAVHLGGKPSTAPRAAIRPGRYHTAGA